MSEDRSEILLNEARSVVVAESNGTVIAQNKWARRLMGHGTGKLCWDVVGKMENARRLPCREGCVGELLASGEDARRTRFKLDGEDRQLNCNPVNGVVVCTLGSECLLTSEKTRSNNFRPTLSSREWQILQLLADGKTTSSTAEQLGVGESTVRTHIERMRSKFCVNTRAAAVAEGFRLGYLD